uniref:sodium- and chloride-dependent GABA transporter 3-like n=1 Tax=Ciona intestinalis TaxID=7719 RepID=UPI000180C7CA|nr:sodium- and chloride-dependent GABA transporter 3-like [Ciona intestinalis]|eukprot:XP_002126541.1 sodium- and chloride-dependent GABA transporter 3-like [Ciona intestinalis]
MSEKKTDSGETKRETWGGKQEFILALIGYSVGLGNVWRFPYLCYDNGGGAFLIPYAIFVVLAGIPLFFLEISLGQYTQQSCVKVWSKLVPAMKGIGYGSAVVNFMCAIYFVLVMSWSVLYFVHSCIPGPLPWTSCGNWWNSEHCVLNANYKGMNATMLQQVSNTSGFASALHTTPNKTNNTTIYSPENEFWNNYVLRKSDGIENIGSLENWPLILCFFGSWVVIYLCVFKGARTSGKVVYVTAILPYVMLLILLIRGLTLEGASTGIMFFLRPDFSKLLSSQVWMQAGGQIFYSYGICFTVLYAFGSYNPYNNNCYKQSVILASTCSLTSIFASFVVFSIIGHMSFVQGKDIDAVATSGPGLVFLVYPVGLSLLPAPNLWSVLFFATLFMVGIDTQFAGVESCVTIFLDLWPNVGKGKYGRELVSAMVCLLFIVLGLPLLTNGGIYIFELFNMYAVSGIALLWLAFFQSITIGWIYGVDNYYENVKSMIGYYPSPYFKLCYKFFAPGISLFIFIFYCVKYAPLTLGQYVFPGWANAVGWFLSLTSMLCVPGFFIAEICKSKGSVYQRIRKALNPVVINEKTSRDDVQCEKRFLEDVRNLAI